MSEISVELVPRDPDSLLAEAADLANHAPWATTINVPDLTRFALRSWDACALLAERVRRPDNSPYRLVPHIRAVDFDPEQPLPFLPVLDEAGITDVLVVTGDDGEWFRASWPVDAVDVVRRIKAEAPGMRVWAGLDPYRQGIADELRYVERKLAAGADGLFSQPFFDLNLVRVWASVLPGVPVWWGATTVTTPASMGYWRRRNRAAFPHDFSLTVEHQRSFAESLLAEARATGQSAYLMPVRTPPAEYLSGLRVE